MSYMNDSGTRPERVHFTRFKQNSCKQRAGPSLSRVVNVSALGPAWQAAAAAGRGQTTVSAQLEQDAAKTRGTRRTPTRTRWWIAHGAQRLSASCGVPCGCVLGGVTVAVLGPGTLSFRCGDGGIPVVPRFDCFGGGAFASLAAGF
ncbi:unnamed protein product [Lampetra fluviatilis]